MWAVEAVGIQRCVSRTVDWDEGAHQFPHTVNASISQLGFLCPVSRCGQERGPLVPRPRGWMMAAETADKTVEV